ncbi:50S ribosomal protein L21e [Candidatus Woesearchaeota archaeon]|nr:50S ribosomal protein L21e [Candidatus Woesearchaeota archaeon]
MKRVGGFRRRTRHKYQKHLKQKGKISLQKYFQEFKVGDKVMLAAEPAVQKGMYFRRFHSNVGTVQGKRGRCYLIKIHDLNKEKIVIVHPVHLKLP